MNLLVVSVGNTRVGFGVFQDGQLTRCERHKLGEDESRLIEAAQVWGKMTADSNQPAVIASVNPPVGSLVAGVLAEDVGMKVLVVGMDLPLPINTDLPAPEQVGVDRLLNAAMAFERMQGPVAVIDAGTAITIDCVSAEGVFLGGCILPGLGLSARGLREKTALLPEVELVRPDWVFGKDTRQAIVGGIYLGAVGAIREILERYATELGAWPVAVVTGGDGELLRAECDFIQAYVPDLTLMGIELAYRQFQKGEGL